MGRHFQFAECTMPLMNAVMALTQLISISIDPSVWMYTSRIEWPDEHEEVLVLKPVSGNFYIGCGDVMPHDARDIYFFRLGEHCNRLIVLMEFLPSPENARKAEAFIGHHEAFHLAVQMYGFKVPWEFLSIDPTLVKRYSYKNNLIGIYGELDKIYEAVTEYRDVSCNSLWDRYSRLNEGERRYLDYKMFWEWPAEFYAEQVIFGKNFTGYQEFRGRLFYDGNEGFELFVSGVKVGMILDKLMGREKWQERVADGVSMFDLLLSELGCTPPTRGFGVRMKRVNLMP